LETIKGAVGMGETLEEAPAMTLPPEPEPKDVIEDPTSASEPVAEIPRAVLEEGLALEENSSDTMAQEEIAQDHEILPEEGDTPAAQTSMPSSLAVTTEVEEQEISPSRASSADSSSADSPETGVAGQRVRIAPRTKVWVGKIDLENHEKNDFMAEQPFELQLEKPFLLVTGHGDLNLTLEGNNSYLNRENPVRFYFDGERFRIIDLNRFRELNRGDLW